MDFDIQPGVASVTEFLAVLIAGYGNNLSPLTGDNGDEPCPKALLPVANKPMIDYPLTWLDQAGIKDVLLICPATHRSAILNHINNDSTSSSFSSLCIDLQSFDESTDDEPGTATVLRQFSGRIKSDFILLPCDFLPPPSLPLSAILNKYRMDVGANSAIMTSCWFEVVNEKGLFEDGESRKPCPIMWDAKSSTLLHVQSADEQDTSDAEYGLRTSLINQYPRIQMSARFEDSHVYVCRRTILDVLGEKIHFDSIKEDFVPWICKLQYQSLRRDKYGPKLISNPKFGSQHAALELSTTHHASQKPTDSFPMEQDDEQEPLTFQSLRVGLMLHRLSDGFAVRTNTLNTLLEANRHVLSSPDYAYTPPTDPDRKSLVDAKAQVSTDSMIGESSKVGERTTIKKSIIGKHCTIGKSAKIVGCVILDHCVIEDGAKLESCLIGINTKIGSKADLTKCVTQAGYEVDAGENIKNEKLEASNWAAGNDSDMQDADQDNDTESD